MRGERKEEMMKDEKRKEKRGRRMRGKDERKGGRAE